MAWVKLDDQFFRNPKIIAAGRDARDLYLAGLCYCGSGLTDGRIPFRALRMLAADAEIDTPKDAAQALVSAGLWSVDDQGDYIVHDYLKYNPTKDRVLATREVRAEAGSRGGKQKASNLLESGLTFARENLQAKSYPVPSRPVPQPVYETTTTTTANGHAPANTNTPCAYAAAVGEERFSRLALNFERINPQLDRPWLNAMIATFEHERPSTTEEVIESVLKQKFPGIVDAFSRDHEVNRIRNPRAFVAKELRTAIQEEGQTG